MSTSLIFVCFLFIAAVYIQLVGSRDVDRKLGQEVGSLSVDIAVR